MQRSFVAGFDVVAGRGVRLGCDRCCRSVCARAVGTGARLGRGRRVVGGVASIFGWTEEVVYSVLTREGPGKGAGLGRVSKTWR